MNSVVQSNKTAAPLMPEFAEAHASVALGNHRYLLDNGCLAQQAISCLITPEVGDRILAVRCPDGDYYIVHVLSRICSDDFELKAPGARRLVISQSRITLTATEDISLRALRNAEITAATGTLALNAKNLFATVSESLVQNVRHYVGKAEQYLLDVGQLLRLHGQQTMITADKDVKVDGERISMG